jgi:SAM-dependent methyltransferase
MTMQKGDANEITERLGPGSSTWTADSAGHLARYLYAAKLVEGRRVLDAGTGLGYGAAILKEAGARSVQAVDIDAPSIARAREAYRIDGLDYLVDNCESLANVSGPFDVICNFENIEHLRHPERFLAASARLLADDGVLLCSTPEPDPAADGQPKNPFHVTEWNREGFRALLSGSFADVEIRVQVELLAATLRMEAAQNLNDHLSYLWAMPLARLSRAIAGLIGRRRAWAKVDALGAPAIADYLIAPAHTASIVGKPMCHFAFCRSPRR